MRQGLRHSRFCAGAWRAGPDQPLLRSWSGGTGRRLNGEYVQEISYHRAHELTVLPAASWSPHYLIHDSEYPGVVQGGAPGARARGGPRACCKSAKSLGDCVGVPRGVASELSRYGRPRSCKCRRAPDAPSQSHPGSPRPSRLHGG